jgi:hypothetical protein
MTRPPPSPVRRTTTLVLYNIAATLVLILALEGMASVYYVFRDAFVSPPVAESLYTAYDRDLGWVNLPNIYLPNMYGPGKYLRTNSQRFRNNKDFTTVAAAGKTRIVCSGDSFTLGFGVDNDHTWPQLLATRNPNIETVNMGQGGYGADQAYLWYKRDGAVLDPDIQIFALIAPDFYRMQHAAFNGYGKPMLTVKNGHLATTNVPVPRSMEVWSPRLARATSALSNLSLTRLLRKVFRLDTAAAVTRTQQNRSQETSSVLTYMLDDLLATNQGQNTLLVLAYLPTREEYSADLGSAWRNFLADYAHQRGILYLDFADDFHHLSPEQLDEFFIARGAIDFPGAAGHYTDAGNAFVADLFYRRLLANPDAAAKLHVQPVGGARSF